MNKDVFLKLKKEIKKISNEEFKDDKPIEKLLIINSKNNFDIYMEEFKKVKYQLIDLESENRLLKIKLEISEIKEKNLEGKIKNLERMLEMSEINLDRKKKE